MEVFHGQAHLPGASEPWDIELSIDWAKSQVYLRVPQAPGGITDWSGVMVQTIGKEEVLFRTKGMPGAIAHWWHMFRNRGGGLFGMVLGLPDSQGAWTQCAMLLDRGELSD